MEVCRTSVGQELPWERSSLTRRVSMLFHPFCKYLRWSVCRGGCQNLQDGGHATEMKTCPPSWGFWLPLYEPFWFQIQSNPVLNSCFELEAGLTWSQIIFKMFWTLSEHFQQSRTIDLNLKGSNGEREGQKWQLMSFWGEKTTLIRQMLQRHSEKRKKVTFCGSL